MSDGGAAALTPLTPPDSNEQQPNSAQGLVDQFLDIDWNINWNNFYSPRPWEDIYQTLRICTPPVD
jgi:hypothetical protein